ncbi:MAG: tetratricopeptide repeat protein [Acaryochloridaceae cyanobacterium SU_2_1]|nr:tetratricopeptide repeat protein [Acaryochloridaceae cyanobacterium SU_2_1]
MIMEDQLDAAAAYFDRGLSLHRQFELEAAMAAYQRAIELDASYDPPYMNLGLALIESQQLDQASLLFDQILALPERSETPASIHTLAHYNLAIIYRRQGKIGAAIKQVEAALDLNSGFQPAKTLHQQLCVDTFNQ